MVAYCAHCGRVFDNRGLDICHDCLVEKNRTIARVRDHLKSHPTSGLADVLEQLDVHLEFVVDGVEDGRIDLTAHPNFQLNCEGCGKMTQGGRFCAACRRELTVGFSRGHGKVDGEVLRVRNSLVIH